MELGAAAWLCRRRMEYADSSDEWNVRFRWAALKPWLNPYHGTTVTAVAIVNSIKVRTAELLTERGLMPPVITRASVVGAERSRALFDAAYREHSRRLARAIDRGSGHGATGTRQEVTRTA